MFIEFHSKANSGELVRINPAHVITFSTDADGIGSLIILSSGIERTVTEDYATVFHMLIGA